MVTSPKLLWLSLLELMLVPATLTTGARARCLLFQSTGRGEAWQASRGDELCELFCTLSKMSMQSLRLR